MTTTTATQQKATEGGTQEPPTPKKQLKQTERTTTGVWNVAESPREDSRKAQTVGPGAKSTNQGPPLSIPVLTGSTTHQILPKGSAQRNHDGNTSNVQNPFVIDQWRDRPPHIPLAPAFASLHLRTPTKQTARQHSTSAPSIPRFRERVRPSLETIDIDENEEETSNVGEDPMDMLNLCEEEIWENSPFRNHQLQLKIRKVAHKQT
jgi:hypothetical protein